jgi:hypothetical protein
MLQKVGKGSPLVKVSRVGFTALVGRMCFTTALPILVVKPILLTLL